MRCLLGSRHQCALKTCIASIVDSEKLSRSYKRPPAVVASGLTGIRPLSLAHDNSFPSELAIQIRRASHSTCEGRRRGVGGDQAGPPEQVLPGTPSTPPYSVPLAPPLPATTGAHPHVAGPPLIVMVQHWPTKGIMLDSRVHRTAVSGSSPGTRGYKVVRKSAERTERRRVNGSR